MSACTKRRIAVSMNERQAWAVFQTLEIGLAQLEFENAERTMIEAVEAIQRRIIERLERDGSVWAEVADEAGWL